MEMEKLTAMKNNMSKKTREKVAKAGLIVNTTAMMMVLNMTNVLAVNSNTFSIFGWHNALMKISISNTTPTESI